MGLEKYNAEVPFDLSSEITPPTSNAATSGKNNIFRGKKPRT